MFPRIHLVCKIRPSPPLVGGHSVKRLTDEGLRCGAPSPSWVLRPPASSRGPCELPFWPCGRPALTQLCLASRATGFLSLPCWRDGCWGRGAPPEYPCLGPDWGEQNRLGERDDRRDQKRASPSLGLSGVAGNAETTFSDWDKPGSIPRPGSPSRPAVWEQCARYRLRASIQFTRMRRLKGDLDRPEPRTGRPRMPGREP